MILLIGILQGRLTESKGRGIQFFPTENWRNEFKIAKKIGFDCIELLVQDEGIERKENPLFSLEGIKEISEIAKKSGVIIKSVHGFYDKKRDYSERIKQLIEHSSSLGVKTILIPFFDDNILSNNKDKQFARKQLSEALSLCKNLNICLGIETEMPAEELLDFILSFGNPYIGIYYDIGNMASMGVNLAEEIHLLGRHIYGVHIKDRLPNGGKTVPLGEGCADFKSAFTALKEIGYNGPLIIHGARSSDINDAKLNKQYLQFTKKILKEVWSE